MATTNKVRYGLKNVHYALVDVSDDGVVSYGTPKAYKGAVSLSIDAETGDKVTEYADDGIWWEGAGANNGYTGTLEMASSDSRFDFEQEVLGFTKDANGNIVENADAESKKIALLFEFTGDKNAIKYVFYNCIVSRSSISGNTKEDTFDPTTDSFDLSMSPAEDTRDVKLVCPATSSDYANFYDAVVLKSETANQTTKSAKAVAE